MIRFLRPTRSRISGVLLLAGVIMLLLVLAATLIPTRQQDNYAGGTVQFTSNHAFIFKLNDCVSATWSVQGISSVYINGEGAIGEGEHAICVSSDPQSLPTLRVVFLDGSEKIYRLEISILTRLLPFWILLIGGALLIVAGLWIRWGNILRARSGRVGIIVGWVWRAIQMAALVIVLGALLLEWALPQYLTAFGTADEQKRYLLTEAEIAEEPAQTRPLPYVSYGGWPDYPEHNSLGYRGPEIAIPKPDGVFRILALGHSTTYSIATSAEEAYPAQLQAILRERGYSSVEVINTGIPGYTSWEVLANYVFRYVELQPDLLIFTDITNDVALRTVAPDCYAGMNPLRGLNPMRTVAQLFRSNTRSTLYRFLAVNSRWMLDPTRIVPGISYLGKVCSTSKLDPANLALNPPTYFERNLRELTALARANGTAIMFSSSIYSPVLEDKESPPEWKVAVDDMNQVLAHLADELDVPFYDLAASGIAQIESNWADPRHLTAAGNHEQARQYADFLIAQGLLPAPSP